MEKHTLVVLSNLILFQVGWFSCVWSAAANRPWIGVLVTVGVVVIHLLNTPMPKKELQLILVTLGIGLVFDSFLVVQGWLKYSSGNLVPNISP